MLFFKKLLITLVVLFTLLTISLYAFGYDYLITAVRTIYLTGHTTAYLDDYKKFDNRLVKTGKFKDPWPLTSDYNKIPVTKKLDSIHKANGTVAYLIIKNDSIWHEQYFDGYGLDSKSNSFSMAKTFVSALLGKAIMDGYINSLDQPVGDFFPEFSEGLAAKLTVGDLASMSSGLNWDEAYYSPFSITTRAYFDEDLRKVILGLKVVEEPGKAYKYLSGNTQLLAMVIEKATGMKLSQYFSESFWAPMGAEHEAYWQLDSAESGMEKAYCCFASNARDFARMGRLYKDRGYWNGNLLLASQYVYISTKPRFEKSPEYGYGLWLKDINNKKFFMLRGHLGQYVIVNPLDNLIIVRLGHDKGAGDAVATFTPDISVYIEEAYKMLNKPL